MSKWAENLEAIKKHYPQYHIPIRKAKDITGVEIIPSKTHLPSLKINGNYIYDAENPIQAIAQHTAELSPTGAMMGIFLGLGLGYDPLYYMEQVAKDAGTEYCLIVEPDFAMAKLACQHTPLEAMILHDNITLMLGVPEEELFIEFAKWLKDKQKYHNLRAVKFYYNPEVYKLNQPYFEAVQQKLVQAANFTMLEYGNDPVDSLTGVVNMLKNLNEIINYPGINMLKDSCKDIPAIVVSTGPSLDKNKHLLKGLENKAVIIAADASLKPLLNIGFKPHIVATLEREMDVVKLFEGIGPEQIEDCYLAGCPVIFPEVYKAYPGKHIVVYRNFDHFKWLGIDKGILDIKLSAGNMAFNVAEHLGCNPIILIGQDLALAGGKTNADGAVLGTEQDSYLKEPRYKVKANDGGEIETTRSLKSFLDAYTIDVANYKGQVINATEGGAYINGTEVMTFAEAIEKYMQNKHEISETIKQALSQFEPKGDKEKVLQLITRTIEVFSEMKSVCEKGQAYIESLNPEPSDAEIEEAKNTVTNYKMEVTKDYQTWQLFFAHIGQAWFLNFELEMKQKFEKGRTEAICEITKEHVRWFSTMHKFFTICQTILRDAEGELK